jgi:hypothetical protein
MMSRRLATTYAKLHRGVRPPPEPLPPILESSSYLDVLEDSNTNMSMTSEEEEEVTPPPCGPLQAILLGSFKTAHRESSMRALRAITLEQTKAAITDCAAEISMEFTAKEAATKKLIEAER